jgi:hypothetical protein
MIIQEETVHQVQLYTCPRDESKQAQLNITVTSIARLIANIVTETSHLHGLATTNFDAKKPPQISL